MLHTGGKMEITINDVMSIFSKIGGVSGIAIISQDGFIIESTLKDSINQDALAALLATEFTRQQDLGREFNLNGLNQLSVEFNGGNLLLVNINQGLLAIFSEKQVFVTDLRDAV